MRRHRGVVLAALFMVVASPVVMLWSWETDRVDQCLVRGGTFDYGVMECDQSRGAHLFIPFVDRHPRVVAGTLVAALIAVAVGVIVTRERADGGRHPDRAGVA
jgi:hypothetical protein